MATEPMTTTASNGGPQLPPQPQQQQKLSDQEVAVLKECEKDSFYRRALPLSCGAFLAAQFLVRSGKLARHPRLGALPKSMIAGGVAYMFGKLSYLPECRRRILEKVPDGQLAAQITKGQNTGQRQQDAFGNQLPASDNNQQPEFGSSRSNKHSGSSDKAFEGLNDSFRPSLDNEVKPGNEQEKKKSMTYDELRERNRQEYKDGLNSPPNNNQPSPRQPGAPSYKDSPYMPQKTWPDRNGGDDNYQDVPPESRSPPPPPPPTKRKRTNIWGDVIED